MATRIAWLLIVLAVPAVLLAACGESDEEKAQAQVCDARDDIGEQVEQLESLTLTTATTGQINENLNAIRDDLSSIADALGDLSDDRRQEVKAANDAFKSSVADTVEDLGSSLSLEDAAGQLEQAFKQLASSYESSFGRLDCS